MASALGLQADCAAGGDEALHRVDRADAADAPYDIVLLDWKMPGMDGIETARRLHACDPAMVVVLISLDEIPDGLSGDVAACVRKQELSTRTLRELWDRHGHSRASG
jgi:DNA-binding response OmpR family regulator